MTDAPPGAQPLQHDRAEHGVAVLGALALLDPKGHALAVHIADLEPANLAGAQAGAVSHRQRRLVLDVARRGNQRCGLLHAQHDGHGARQLDRLHPGHQLAAAQGDVEEELQPRQRRVGRDGRGAGIDQVQLEVAQVLDGGGVGRALKELGQLANGADVGFLRPRLQLAHAHVFDHALTQRRTRAGGRVHGCSSVGERGTCLAHQLRRTSGAVNYLDLTRSDCRESGLVLRPSADHGGRLHPGLFNAPAAAQRNPDQALARNSRTPRPSLRRSKARRVTPSE